MVSDVIEEADFNDEDKDRLLQRGENVSEYQKFENNP